MFGFGKKKKKNDEPKVIVKKGIHAILERLEPQNFFNQIEDKQLVALDGLNKFIVTQEKMFKAIDAGMLDTVTNLVKLANDYHLLPIPHARIMEQTQTLVAIPSLKVRFGVEANLCNVLCGEIQELVDGILASVKELEQRAREGKQEELLLAREKAGATSTRKRKVRMMMTFVPGKQPLGITVGVPKLKPTGGIIQAMQFASQATGMSEKDWDLEAEHMRLADIILEEEKARLLADPQENMLINDERKKRIQDKNKEEKKIYAKQRMSEESAKLILGDEIVKINKQDVLHLNNTQIQKKLKMLMKKKKAIAVYFVGLRDPSETKGLFWQGERERIAVLQAKEKEDAFIKRKTDKEKATKKQETADKNAKEKVERKKKKKEAISQMEKEGMDFQYEVTFGAGSLGLGLKAPKSGGLGCIVQSIADDGQAAKIGSIKPGHRPIRIGSTLIVKMKVKDIIKLIGKSKRPLIVKFKGREKLKEHGSTYKVKFYKGPMGMKLVERKGAGPLGDGVSVGHVQQNGFAERTGDINVGDIINKFGPADEKKGPMEDVRHIKLSKLLKKLKEIPRPAIVEFITPDLETELLAAHDFEVAEENRIKEETRIKKEPDYTIILSKKPHGIVLEPFILPGPKDTKIKSAGARIKHVISRSEASTIRPRPVRAGDKLMSINGKNVEKRPLSFVANLMRTSTFPLTLILHNEQLQKVRNAEAIVLRPLEKRFMIEEPMGGLEYTHIDEDYSVGIGLNRITGSRVGAKVEAVSDRGDAKKIGVQRDWHLVRIAGVDVKELELQVIRDMLSTAVRPYILDFDIVTLKSKKTVEKKTTSDNDAAAGGDGGGGKKKTPGIFGKMKKKQSGGVLTKGKVNMRSLLWTAAPKALPQPALTTDGEGMVELIPEYAKPLAELIKNDICKKVTATGITFATLANVLMMFFKIKSRSEHLVRPTILKMCTTLTDTPAGLKAFVGVNKLVGHWIGFLWDAQGHPLVLNDLVTQLHRVALMPGIEEHAEYQSMFVARSVVNLLNAIHGTLLRDKSGAGTETYIRLIEILTHICDDSERLKMVLSSYYHRPGLPGLWNILPKLRKVPVLQRTVKLLRIVTVDRDGILYSAYSKGTRYPSAGESPNNVLNMLIMSMNRAKLNHGGFEFEYDFQSGPIGLKLDVAPGRRSGSVIKSVTKDSQADRAGIIEPGDILLKIGKKNVEKYPLDRAMDAMRSEPRPMTLEFRKPNVNDGVIAEHAKYTLRFDSGPIGLKLVHLADGENGARVQFIEPDTQAAANDEIKIGHVVYSVGDVEVFGKSYSGVLQELKRAKRPCLVTFMDPTSRSPDEERADSIMCDVQTVIVKVMEHDHKMEEEIETNPDRAAEIRSFHQFHEMAVQDAILILELIFQRMLRRPKPSKELIHISKEAIMMCARTDYVQTSSLYIPAFLHLNHLDAGEVQPDYDVEMIQGLVIDITKLIDECPEIAVRVGRAGGVGTCLRSFNRLQEAAEKGEDAELSTLENEIIRWNKSMMDLLEEILPHKNEILSDILADTAPSLIANLFLVSMWCGTVAKHEQQRLLTFIEQADTDGDGQFDVEKDNPAFAEEIKCCKERMELLNIIEAQIYACIFEACRVHKSCTKEVMDPKFLPSVMDAIVQMTLENDADNVRGLYSMAHLLSMITVDESHVVLLFTPPGALTLVQTTLAAFEYIMDTESFLWTGCGLSEHIIAESHGGQEQATVACMSQVLVQVLRVVDIKEDLDKRSSRVLSEPLLIVVIKLLDRTVRQASIVFGSNSRNEQGAEYGAYTRCQQSLVLVLYEFSTMKVFRPLMSKLKVPRGLLDVLVYGHGLDSDTMVACAGTLYNIMLESKARPYMQDYSKGTVLYDMCEMFNKSYAKSVHMKALLLASIRSIVDSTRAPAIEAAGKMRHIIPILIKLQADSCLIPESTKKKPRTQTEQMIMTAATEGRELMRILTHVKYGELRSQRESVITGRHNYAAGTMSVATLKSLHNRRLKKLHEERGFQDPQHAKGKKPHLGRVIGDDNDLEEDQDTSEMLGGLTGEALEVRMDVTFDQYGEVIVDGDKLRMVAQGSRSSSSPNGDSSAIDMLKWADIEYESHRIRASDYNRNAVIEMERFEEERHDEEEAEKAETAAGHSKFMQTASISTYVDNITTVSKHAEKCFAEIQFGLSTDTPRTHEETVRFLPKVEVGSKEFSMQQDAIIGRQMEERAHIREELLKLRGKELSGITAEHQTLRDRDYHIDRKALRGLAKTMVYGEVEAKSPRRASTLNGLPTLNGRQMGRRDSFGFLPEKYVQDQSQSNNGTVQWEHSAPDVENPGMMSPKMRFMKTK